MKKFLAFMMAVLLLAACAGCSAGDNNTDDTQGSSTSEAPSQTQGTEPNTQETTNPENETKLDGVTWVGGRKITINYNDGRRVDTKSDSLVFHSKSSNAIALTYDDSSSYTGPVDNVFNILNDGDLFEDISTYTGTSFNGDNPFLISVVSSEKVTVAGFDSVKILGTVTDADGKEASVYGYTFVIDKTPCMLAGVIRDAANNPDVVNAVREEVDLMAQTIKEA